MSEMSEAVARGGVSFGTEVDKRVKRWRDTWGETESGLLLHTAQLNIEITAMGIVLAAPSDRERRLHSLSVLASAWHDVKEMRDV